MLFIGIIFVVRLKENHVSGIDLNSLIPRTNCYQNEQPNCNEEFIEVYPILSKSVTGLTNASTWFLLFTRKNPEAPEKLHKCGGKLTPNSNFNPGNRLIVMLVSFVVGMCDIALHREWMYQFLEREDVNVLVVDYSWGNHLDIETTNQNIKIVTNQTVIVLKHIQEETGIKKEQIYLMGLSLGAQVAGLIGYLFPVGRISGIDPGGPGYTLETPLKDRLDRSDADLVDVYHTNAGQCAPNFGIGYDAGDVDFWINGGLFQPSCYHYALISIIKGDFIYGIGTPLLPTLCSHVQSSQYYKVSINPGNCQFVGIECDSYKDFKLGRCRSCGKSGEKCLIMGYDTDKYVNASKLPQRYYVQTTLHCPYCNNRYLRLEGYERTYKSSLQT